VSYEAFRERRTLGSKHQRQASRELGEFGPETQTNDELTIDPLDLSTVTSLSESDTGATPPALNSPTALPPKEYGEMDRVENENSPAEFKDVKATVPASLARRITCGDDVSGQFNACPFDCNEPYETVSVDQVLANKRMKIKDASMEAPMQLGGILRFSKLDVAQLVWIAHVPLTPDFGTLDAALDPCAHADAHPHATGATGATTMEAAADAGATSSFSSPVLPAPDASGGSGAPSLQASSAESSLLERAMVAAGLCPATLVRQRLARVRPARLLACVCVFACARARGCGGGGASFWRSKRCVRAGGGCDV
jgi:hypothetical protein